jgi:hypothetical protein|tara:strand:- start:3433 stop:4248 length:816 start_codon:yes stop_codon:yes gene_type:complete
MDTLAEFAEIRDRAACSGQFDAGQEIWVGVMVEIVSGKGISRTIMNPHFPPDDGGGEDEIQEHPTAAIARVNEAMKICRSCQVLAQCEKFTKAKPPISTGIVQAGIYFPPPLQTAKFLKRQSIENDAKNLVRLQKKTANLLGHINTRNRNLAKLIAKARSRKPLYEAGLIRNFMKQVTRKMPWVTNLIGRDTPVAFFPDGKPKNSVDMVVDVLNDEHYANLIRNGGLPQSAATVGILSETNQKFEIHGLLSTFEELGESPLTDWLDIPGNS